MLVSFIIPAHNEESLLPATLRSLHAAAAAVLPAASAPAYEIVVADDASTDRTATVAREGGALVVPVDRRQIAAARNAGAVAARGRVLIFVDADTTVPAATLRAALAALEAGAAGGGCAVRFDGRVPRWASITLPVVLFLFRLAKVAGGCFIFCTREALTAAGGWDETLYASEELALAGALKRHGRFVVLRESVVTSGRKVRTYSLWEVLAMIGNQLRRGRGAYRSREGLDLWYGERRADPEGSALRE